MKTQGSEMITGGNAAPAAALDGELNTLRQENSQLKAELARVTAERDACRQTMGSLERGQDEQVARITSLESALAAAQADKERLKAVYSECVVALETLYASDTSKPIEEIGPQLRNQIYVAVRQCREYARLDAATPPGAKEGGKTL